MVRAFTLQPSMQKANSFHMRRMDDNQGRQLQSLIPENGHEGNVADDKLLSNSYESGLSDGMMKSHRIGCASNRDAGPVSCSHGRRKPDIPLPKSLGSSDMELMKERFSKLLLGEDMSGGGKGVSSALALSNAITNLAASVFGEHRKLEPMTPETKARWRKEMDWFLSVTDYIVELVPSQRRSDDGTSMEIMVPRQRIDLLMNIPALCKLDSMLIDLLDSFGDHKEFWYASKHEDDNSDQSKTDQWWLPTVKIFPNGLSDAFRRWMDFQKESVNQVLKAAMAINAQVLLEMEVPESYTESLPKNGRESLGDAIYKSITEDYFDPQQFLSSVDLSTEHKVIDLKNRIEASVVIWRRKMNNKDAKSPWVSAVSLEKREIFEERAETILVILKQRFPGIPQSALDISKIEYNKDVGQAILESYSRIIESFAYQIFSRIEDVLKTDSITRESTSEKCNRWHSMDSSPLLDEAKSTNFEEAAGDLQASENTKTLLDIMGWNPSQRKSEMKKNNSTGDLQLYFKGLNDKPITKANNVIPKKVSYLEKVESLSVKSPTPRD